MFHGTGLKLSWTSDDCLDPGVQTVAWHEKMRRLVPLFSPQAIDSHKDPNLLFFSSEKYALWSDVASNVTFATSQKLFVCAIADEGLSNLTDLSFLTYPGRVNWILRSAYRSWGAGIILGLKLRAASACLDVNGAVDGSWSYSGAILVG